MWHSRRESLERKHVQRRIRGHESTYHLSRPDVFDTTPRETFSQEVRRGLAAIRAEARVSCLRSAFERQVDFHSRKIFTPADISFSVTPEGYNLSKTHGNMPTSHEIPNPVSCDRLCRHRNRVGPARALRSDRVAAPDDQVWHCLQTLSGTLSLSRRRRPLSPLPWYRHRSKPRLRYRYRRRPIRFPR